MSTSMTSMEMKLLVIMFMENDPGPSRHRVFVLLQGKLEEFTTPDEIVDDLYILSLIR